MLVIYSDNKRFNLTFSESKYIKLVKQNKAFIKTQIHIILYPSFVCSYLCPSIKNYNIQKIFCMVCIEANSKKKSKNIICIFCSLLYLLTKIIIIEEKMFKAIKIISITQKLGDIIFGESLSNLSELFIFKSFNIDMIIRSKFSAEYFDFFRTSIKLIALQTYLRLIDEQKTQFKQWVKQINETSKIIIDQYCNINQKLKSNRKIQVTDLLIFLACLLAKEFLEKLFNATKKYDIRQDKAWGQNLQKSVNNGQYGNENILLTQQYAFIILMYQITGVFVSPYTFQHLRKKYIKRQIYHQKSTAAEQIIQSLKYIKQNINRRNQGYLTKIRNPMGLHPFIRSMFKIAQDQKATQKKSTKQRKPIDGVSLSLHHFLNQGHQQSDQTLEQFQAPERIQKITSRTLSRAAKVYFGIQSSEVSEQEKQLIMGRKSPVAHSESSKPKVKSYILNFKSINTCQAGGKVKQMEHNKIAKQSGNNWPNIIDQLKKKYQKNIRVQKFDTFYREPDGQQRQILDRLKQISSEVIQPTQKRKLRFLPSINFTEAGQKQQNSLEWKSTSFQISQTQQKFHSINYEQSDKNRKQQSKFQAQCSSIKKKLLDVKMHKKAFQQKCRQRKLEIIGSSH